LVFPYIHKVFTEDETGILAEEFASTVSPGEVIVLNGNLGSGKTFFIKKLLKSFNIDSVSSPTFALVNEYYGELKFYHFDFYRIEQVREIYDIGFNEYMKDDEAVKFIEWGELFNSVLPRRRTEIQITLDKDFNREFSFNKYE
jgi:tRNA threonylcarbamoyladenosine biosynthesis protein TsaE